MSNDTDTQYGTDPRLRGSATRGSSATRRAMIHHAKGPAHRLDALGVENPDNDFEPQNAIDVPTTKELPDGTHVHLHQDVREDMDDGFGDFGANEDDSEDVVWTVVDLRDGAVTITVVGDWGKRRTVPDDEFAEDYDPIVLDGSPKWGY